MTATLTSIEAAAFLKKHVVTVRQLANAGTIPAAKAGRDWLFLEVDLIEFLRGQYRRPAAPTPGQCLSTSKPAPLTGGRVSLSPASHAYVDRLAKRIEQKRNASTTSGRHKRGD